MPAQERRSSRWCCRARAHALAQFQHDIVPGDVTKFQLRKRASPLLAPNDEAGPRHDRALLHHILKDQQRKHAQPDMLSVDHCADRSAQAETRSYAAEASSVRLPHIIPTEGQAEKHKGLSNGMLHTRCQD